jgi:molybdopterin converting factor small subunit
MEVEVTFYGALVQSAGARTRVVNVDGDSPTVRDLRAAVAREVPAVAEHLGQAAVGIGTELSPDDALLDPAEEISLLPPVSGG